MSSYLRFGSTALATGTSSGSGKAFDDVQAGGLEIDGVTNKISAFFMWLMRKKALLKTNARLWNVD